ncbi:hypothetical protein FLK61_36110 [Paenalkalicoccus suaedae]|uniref:Uncharacterized protein n=1 Tax=Paenalkalicoccus suaedae TaxID=2592382 RepID=A0A859FGZ4_9BACI|nr:hypothetical protein [Paenalkalicoccus suaedae]QKS72088.1 hypothetical protein FLK61_36110 [Paenalkalicoccus suaedae]
MVKRKANFLIDFEQVKHDRQSGFDTAAHRLYESLFESLLTEVNMREKVRAKHLFKQLADVGEEVNLHGDLQRHFEHWLLFDYITTIGSRPFDLYIRKHKEVFSKEELMVASFFMLAHLTPIRIVRGESSDVEYYVATDETKQIKRANRFYCDDNWESHSLVFVRSIKIGFNNYVMGPSLTINRVHEPAVMRMLKQHVRAGDNQLHRFLKESGVTMLRYQLVN